jgi:hypothetical protein
MSKQIHLQFLINTPKIVAPRFTETKTKVDFICFSILQRNDEK